MNLTIFVMRPGQREGDSLTQRGISQVRTAAETHLQPSGRFDLVIRTRWERARQTAQIIGSNLGCNFPAHYDGEVDDGFDPRSIDEWASPSIDWEIRMRQWYQSRDSAPTVQQLFDEIPQAMFLAGQMSCALKRLAVRLAEADNSQRAVVVSHAPVAEAAVLDPVGFPQLEEGGIVKYTVEVVVRRARITAAEHLACPI